MQRMLAMQLLIFASPSCAIGRDLQERIRSLQLEIPPTYCTSFHALKAYLRKPIGLMSIGVLIPSDERALTDLIGMRHLLRDMRLIVILPASRLPNRVQAHMLRPRFISDADGDLEDVTAVICKMKDAVGTPAVQTAD
jgi:hypothetical protein